MRFSPSKWSDVVRPIRRLGALLSTMTMTAGLVVAVAPVASAADSITDLGVSVGITCA